MMVCQTNRRLSGMLGLLKQLHHQQAVNMRRARGRLEAMPLSKCTHRVPSCNGARRLQLNNSGLSRQLSNSGPGSLQVNNRFLSRLQPNSSGLSKQLVSNRFLSRLQANSSGLSKQLVSSSGFHSMRPLRIIGDSTLLSSSGHSKRPQLRHSSNSSRQSGRSTISNTGLGTKKSKKRDRSKELPKCQKTWH